MIIKKKKKNGLDWHKMIKKKKDYPWYIKYIKYINVYDVYDVYDIY